MAGAVLSSSDRAHFLEMLRRHTNSAVLRRMNALLLLDDGWTAERVAEVLFIDAETCASTGGGTRRKAARGSSTWPIPDTPRC
jgi:hypothetical protein